MRRTFGRGGFGVVAAAVLLASCATGPAVSELDILPLVTESGPPAYTVFFDLDSAEITSDARQILDRMLADYRRLTGAKLVLAGHADRSGTERHNSGLSKRRAAAVREHLIVSGITPEAIEIEAHGEQAGLVGTPNGAVEPQNRRVEIFVRPG